MSALQLRRCKPAHPPFRNGAIDAARRPSAQLEASYGSLF
jgi:hypothetical protein